MEQTQLVDDEMEAQIRRAATEPASQARKRIPLVVFCFGILCLIIAFILTVLNFNGSPSGLVLTCNNATAEGLLEMKNLQLTKERERLKQQLQKIENHTSEGWLFSRGSFYLVSTTKQSWNKSREFCQEKGADLIIITSTEEQEFARSAFRDTLLASPDPIWIGLSEPDQEGVWKWVDGSPLTTSFFSDGKPDNFGGKKHCVEMKKQYFTVELRNWSDEDCATKQKCICEKRII